MWPTLEIGHAYAVMTRGAHGARAAVLLGFDDHGALLLARYPRGPKARWLPWLAPRAAISGVFGPLARL